MIKNITALAIFMAGMSLSALLPLMFTQAGLLYEDMAGTVLGTIKVAIPLGGILFPFIMATLVQYMNFGLSLIIFPLALFFALILLHFTFSSELGLMNSPTSD